MCVILIGKKEEVLPYINDAQDYNQDGSGVMWAEEGSLHIVRSLDPELFYQKFEDRVPAGQRVVAHFRTQSVGPVTVENIHPLFIHNTLAVAHNGTMTHMGEVVLEEEWSDSRMFAWILSRSLTEGEGIGAFDKWIRKVAGMSRLAFLDGKGELFTYGNWEQLPHNVLASNTRFRRGETDRGGRLAL